MQDEYLEAAPDGEGTQEAAATGMGRQARHVSDTATAAAGAQPASPVSEVQTHAQANRLAAKGPSAARPRPRATSRLRTAKAAQQVNLKADVQQQQLQVQQQKASDDTETRYLRMMQESGVTPEEMEEAY